MIGDDVEVTVLWIDGLKVRLGIDAPSEVPVHRTEVYLEIHSGEQEELARDGTG
jgi:carbon storage regulator